MSKIKNIILKIFRIIIPIKLIQKLYPQIYPQRFVYELNKIHDSRLLNKVILVTGGGGSIGSAICYRVAIEGAKVAVAGRTLTTLNSTIDQIIQAGVDRKNVIPIIMDITKDDSVEKGITEVVKIFGKLDVCINNAGGSARDSVKPLEDQNLTVVEDIIDLNLIGTIRCCKYAITALKNSQGKIINFGSTVGLNGQKLYSEYSASKSAIIGLTKSLALELGEFNINVNMVTPGWVWRNAFDGNQVRTSSKNALLRYGYPEEVASLVAFLCSDESNYITGNDFKIDGGRTLGLMKE